MKLKLHNRGLHYAVPYLSIFSVPYNQSSVSEFNLVRIDKMNAKQLPWKRFVFECYNKGRGRNRGFKIAPETGINAENRPYSYLAITFSKPFKPKSYFKNWTFLDV